MSQWQIYGDNISKNYDKYLIIVISLNFKEQCYQRVSFPLRYFACHQMNSLSICQPDKVNEDISNRCDLKQKVVPNDLDGIMYDFQHAHHGIEHILRANLHYHLVEGPAHKLHMLFDKWKIEYAYNISHVKSVLDIFRISWKILSAYFLIKFFLDVCNHVKKSHDDKSRIAPHQFQWKEYNFSLNFIDPLTKYMIFQDVEFIIVNTSS